MDWDWDSGTLNRSITGDDYVKGELAEDDDSIKFTNGDDTAVDNLEPGVGDMGDDRLETALVQLYGIAASCTDRSMFDRVLQSFLNILDNYLHNSKSQWNVCFCPPHMLNSLTRNTKRILGNHITICNIFFLTYITTKREPVDPPCEEPDCFPQPPSAVSYQVDFPPPPSAVSFEYIRLAKFGSEPRGGGHDQNRINIGAQKAQSRSTEGFPK